MDRQDGVFKIDLKTCAKNPEGYKIGQSLDKPERGEYGYEYVPIEGEIMNNPYLSYRAIGTIGPDTIVLTDYSGGGTGRFTELLRVRINGDTMEILETLAGGDRCNGGIVDAKIEGNELVTTYFVTPYDMVTLNGQNPQKIEAYNDLESCAVCCVGEATSRNNVLERVALTMEPDEIANYTKPDVGIVDVPLNICFYRYYETALQKTKMLTAGTQLDSFISGFNTSCKKPPVPQ